VGELSESEALKARDAETAETPTVEEWDCGVCGCHNFGGELCSNCNNKPTVVQSIHELELAKIYEEYTRNPSQKLLNDRLKILCDLMGERRRH